VSWGRALRGTRVDVVHVVVTVVEDHRLLLLERNGGQRLARLGEAKARTYGGSLLDLLGRAHDILVLRGRVDGWSRTLLGGCLGLRGSFGGRGDLVVVVVGGRESDGSLLDDGLLDRCRSRSGLIIVARKRDGSLSKEAGRSARLSTRTQVRTHLLDDGLLSSRRLLDRFGLEIVLGILLIRVVRLLLGLRLALALRRPERLLLVDRVGFEEGLLTSEIGR